MRLPTWIRVMRERVGMGEVDVTLEYRCETWSELIDLAEELNNHTVGDSGVAAAWHLLSNQVVGGSMFDDGFSSDVPQLSIHPGWDSQEVRFTADEKAEPIYTRKREARPRDVFGDITPQRTKIDDILDALAHYDEDYTLGSMPRMPNETPVAYRMVMENRDRA